MIFLYFILLLYISKKMFFTNEKTLKRNLVLDKGNVYLKKSIKIDIIFELRH